MWAFERDVRLIFNNCRNYNGAASEFFRIANRLENAFKRRFQRVLAKVRYLEFVVFGIG